jgi:hypothetical protein
LTSRGLARKASPCISWCHRPSLQCLKGKIKRSTGLGHRRFALNNLHHQRCFALGSPFLDVVFHRRAHGLLLSEYHLSRN